MMMGKHNKHSMTYVVNTHRTQITPATWFYYSFYVIYPLLIIWYLYMFYLIVLRLLFKRNKSTIFPGTFWILCIVSNVLDIIGNYFFGNQNYVLSSIIFTIDLLIMYLLTMIGYYVCWSEIDYENEDDCPSWRKDRLDLHKWEIILLRLLTLNAFPLAAIMGTILTFFQWSYVLKYFALHLSDNVACIIALAILAVFLMIFWHMDSCFFRNYFVYTWLPAIGIIFSFAAVIARQHQIGGKQKPALLFAFILLIYSVIYFVLKMLLLCVRSPRENPRFARISQV